MGPAIHHGERESLMQSMTKRIIKVIAGELDLDEVELRQDSSVESVEFWDSLGHLRICMALEAEFNVRIPLDEIANLQSVLAIQNYLVQMGRQ